MNYGMGMMPMGMGGAQEAFTGGDKFDPKKAMMMGTIAPQLNNATMAMMQGQSPRKALGQGAGKAAGTALGSMTPLGPLGGMLGGTIGGALGGGAGK